jgi:excisionase family DNA binding protein
MAIGQPLTPKHYSPQEVATLLGMSVRTILRRIKAGELPASRIGRLLRISDPSLRVFLAERRTP